jgi:hypothetical protein
MGTTHKINWWDFEKSSNINTKGERFWKDL